MRAIFVFLLLAALAGSALGQEFEVVSIKPNRSGSDGTDVEGGQSQLVASNLSLRNLIVMASGLKDYQVEGPDWLASERFDITAKFPATMPKAGAERQAALQVMMRKMLEDRFKLSAHSAEKPFSVYALTVAKSGVKFKEATNCENHNSSGRDLHYEGHCISMEVFAGFLVRRRAELPVDLPVIDLTGLKGSYNLTLDWVREAKDGTPAVVDGKSGSIYTGTIHTNYVDVQPRTAMRIGIHA